MSNLLENTAALQELLTRIGKLPDGSNLTPIEEALIAKGQTIPEGADAEVLASLITALETGGVSGVDLPTGVAIEMGVYAPEEHNYGTAENIQLRNNYIWNAQTAPAFLFLCGVNYNKTDTGVIGGYCIRPQGSSAKRNAICGTSSSTTTTSTAVIDLQSGDTSNVLLLKGTSTYPMRKGVSYLWIVIGATA